MQFKMLRDIEGQQFSDAVRDKLGPRVGIMGETASLDTFCGFFTGVKLTKGTQVRPGLPAAGPVVICCLLVTRTPSSRGRRQYTDASHHTASQNFRC